MAAELGLSWHDEAQVSDRRARTPTPPRRPSARKSLASTPRKCARKRVIVEPADSGSKPLRASLLKRRKVDDVSAAMTDPGEIDAVGQFLDTSIARGGGALYVHGGSSASRSASVLAATEKWQRRAKSEATVVRICCTDLPQCTLPALLAAISRGVCPVASAVAKASPASALSMTTAAASKDAVHALQSSSRPVAIIVDGVEDLLQGLSLVRKAQVLPELIFLPRSAGSTSGSSVAMIVVAETLGPFEQASRLCQHKLECEVLSK
eukprot:TRINITY_DN66100_c0_g1_i1.p1 TRINITY_DN66100_c0_g1~~TRINITY_DN66100_c0_g1_i1.p1  ORF type:complete len:301 (-),score=35.39 TRINITY_DN66100_c0_g1_i1:331-1125(-)